MGLGTTTLIISNDEMEDIIKIFKSYEDSDLLLKGFTETKELKGGFYSMLLVTLRASFLGNMLAGKGINRDREGFIRAGYVSTIKGFFMSSHPLTDFEIKNYYQNESIFDGVYSRGNLPKTKFQEKIRSEAYIIDFDKYSDIGTLWIALDALNNNVTYFDSFGVEHIPKKK